MSLKEELGKKIRLLRKEQKITREVFCEDESELTVRHLARIEAGTSLPTLDKLRYMADRLGVPASTLIDEEKMALPDRYVEIKNKLIRIQTYQDEERIKTKELLYDEVYEDYYEFLPEDEQVTIEILQAIFDVGASENPHFGDVLIEEYFEQLLLKNEYKANDLLLIHLYFIRCLLDSYDQETFEQLATNILKMVDYSNLDYVYLLRKTLVGALSVFMEYAMYERFPPYIESMKQLMIYAQDFQQKPIVDMLEAMYVLYVEHDIDKGSKIYDRAIICAQAFDDEVLEKRIQGQKEFDLEKVRT